MGHMGGLPVAGVRQLELSKGIIRQRLSHRIGCRTLLDLLEFEYVGAGFPGTPLEAANPESNGKDA